MSDSTPTSSLSSLLLVDPIPTPTSPVPGEAKEEKKKKVVNRLAVDHISDFVVLPLDLVKIFNVDKIWCGQGEDSVLVKIAGDGLDKPDRLVPTWMFDASMISIIHGGTVDMRSDIDDGQKGVACAIKANIAYHQQLKALMAKRGISELPPVEIDDDNDESGGCVPQLRWDMVFTVPIQDQVDGKSAEMDAIWANKATLVALNEADVGQWIRDNVIGLKCGSYSTLTSLVGELPVDYKKMSREEFAAWLDMAFVKKAEENAKEKLERETKAAARKADLKRRHDEDLEEEKEMKRLWADKRPKT